MALYVLPLSDWYLGLRRNSDHYDNWSWAAGFLFFEVVKIK